MRDYEEDKRLLGEILKKKHDESTLEFVCELYRTYMLQRYGDEDRDEVMKKEKCEIVEIIEKEKKFSNCDTSAVFRRLTPHPFRSNSVSAQHLLRQEKATKRSVRTNKIKTLQF